MFPVISTFFIGRTILIVLTIFCNINFVINLSKATYQYTFPKFLQLRDKFLNRNKHSFLFHKLRFLLNNFIVVNYIILMQNTIQSFCD